MKGIREYFILVVAGIQYAGGHLRELQAAVKDPISNFGVVLGEVAKRGKAAAGISPGNLLADQVHPNLVDSSGTYTEHRLSFLIIICNKIRCYLNVFVFS